MSKEKIIKDLEFIFTETSFKVDDVNVSLDPIAGDFKKDKYATLYELGFSRNYKFIHSSAAFLYKLSTEFINALSRRPELEVARENTIVKAEDEIIDRLLSIVPFCDW